MFQSHRQKSDFLSIIVLSRRDQCRAQTTVPQLDYYGPVTSRWCDARGFMNKCPSFTLASTLIAAALALTALADESTPPTAPSRLVSNMDFDWRFQQQDTPGAELPGFDDSRWRVLDVPHDWSVENPYSKENTPENSWLPGGTGWYRRMFDAPDDWTQRVVLVRFDGVYMNSKVWLNGQPVGGRPYGFSSFECDLTTHLKPGRNLLAVRADNTPVPTARFYHGSGIYGHVNLLVLPKLHILPNGGVFVRTATANDREARLTVATELNKPVVDAHVYHRLLDADEKPVAEVTGFVSNQTLLVTQPQLWSPDSPYLYTLETTLIQQGAVADRVLTPVGIRVSRFEAGTGFWLNDHNLKLKGVCEHTELMPVGLAVPDHLIEWRLRTLKDMGCNAIRTAHNPMPSVFYDLCDRLGLLVMDEIFDGWSRKGANDYGARFFQDWWKRDVMDWIRRDRNHPCVIIWSIGNETGRKDSHNITGWIHQFDDHTRPTTGGMVTDGVDLAGFNGPGGMPGVLEQFHAKHPDMPIVITEEPHTSQTRGYYRVRTWWRDAGAPSYDFPPYATNEVFTGGHPRYASSYDNAGVRMTARTSWRRTSSWPWLSGEFRWTGFECFGESQFMGTEFPKRTYNSGILDLAGFPKDHYYFYQSQWTGRPMVHLLPHWTHPDIARGTVIPVVAYSNCDEVELFLNGLSLGRQRPRKLLDFVWNVPYHPGELHATGYRAGKAVAEYRHITAGNPARLHLETTNASLHPDRRDISLITVAATDDAGNFIPWAHDDVAFHVTGPVRTLGFENGDPMDGTNPYETHHRLFSGLTRGYFQSTSNDAPVEVAAAAILGNRQFQTGTTVALAANRIALRGVTAPATFTFYYTLDGSQPTPNSPRYDKPFTLDHPANIRALVLRNGVEILELTTQFRQGRPKAVPEDNHFESGAVRKPLDKQLVGRWYEGSRVFLFKADGSVMRLDGSVETLVAHWWYDFPDDIFEAGKDAGQGELKWSHSGDVSRLKLTDQAARELIISTGRQQRKLIKEFRSTAVSPITVIRTTLR